jgi:phosphoribosylglycinamide formyltransferase-1
MSDDPSATNRSPLRRPLRLAVLGSGHGTNLEAILEAIDGGILDAEVVTVLSDRPESRILEVARRAGIPARGLDAIPYAESGVVAYLASCGADLIVLAGFMRIIGRAMLDAWPRRILNVHPSLLPKYPGLKAWEQALDAGETETGCTVHLVDRGIDTGQILGKARVPILPDDDGPTLHLRIQQQEYQLYPQIIRAYGVNLLGDWGSINYPLDYGGGRRKTKQ